MGFYDHFNPHPPPEPEGYATVRPIANGKAHRYAQAALDDECATVAAAGEGTRNDTLNRAWFKLGRHVAAGSIDAEAVRAALSDAASRAGLPAHEIAVVLRDGPTSALTASIGLPRHPDGVTIPEPAVTEVEAGDIMPTNGTTPGPSVALVNRFTDITLRRQRWAWPNMIPVGELTIMAGKQGDGKSTLIHTLVAGWTRGTVAGDWHDTPKNVLILTTEESDQQITARYRANHCDTARVHTLRISHDHEGDINPLDIAMTGLNNLVRTNHIDIIIIDTVMTLAGDVDINRQNEVVRLLDPLRDVAQRNQIAVVGLIHLKKDGNGEADILDMVMSSAGWTTVPRAVVGVIRDPDDPNTRVTGLIKQNLGADEISHHYTVRRVTVGHDPDDQTQIQADQIVWGIESSEPLRDTYRRLRQAKQDASSEVPEIQQHLRAFLLEGGGSREAKHALAHLGGAGGYGTSTIGRACQAMGIVKTKQGMSGGWIWSLPETLAERRSHPRARKDR